jgi:hypothetical protein
VPPLILDSDEERTEQSRGLERRRRRLEHRETPRRP